ncbi:MAG TPA: sulfur carrier protein ThiS [Chthoniobacteraceae bacterium]|nr:sulfur carrier protein ThiS [Chthoniobacteraceae bacterium]
MKELFINGERQTLEEVSTIREVVDRLGLPVALLLVEHNGVALHRSEWERQGVHDGDRLEILRVAAGG